MAPHRPAGHRGPIRQHSIGLGLGLLVLLAVATVACTGEAAVPIDPASPPTTEPDLTDVSHDIEPTDEMRQAAEEQCLDDLKLDQGYIRAVDPEDGRVLAEVVVDCADVRAGSGDG